MIGLATRQYPCRPSSSSMPQIVEITKEFIGESFFATHFSQKGEIFLQDVRFQSELDRIRIYLKEKYDGTSPTETDLLCAPGHLCIARYHKTNRDNANHTKYTLYDLRHPFFVNISIDLSRNGSTNLY